MNLVVGTENILSQLMKPNRIRWLGHVTTHGECSSTVPCTNFCSSHGTEGAIWRLVDDVVVWNGKMRSEVR